MSQFPPEIPVSSVISESAEPYRQPVWPKVVGIISICMGSLQVLMAMGGLASAFVQPMMMKNMQAMGRPPAQTASRPASNPADIMMNPPAEVRSFQLRAPVVSLVAGGLLIFAGIWLLRRRRAARAMHLIDVVAKAAAVAMAIAATWVLMAAMEASAAQSAPKEVTVFFRAGLGASVAMQLLFGMAYPTFLLIWFLRPSIVRQVRQWP